MISSEEMKETMNATTFARRVYWALEQQEMNPRQLELKAGFKSGYLSNLFKRDSKNPHISTVERIAPVLGVSAHWLMTGKGDPELVILPKEKKIVQPGKEPSDWYPDWVEESFLRVMREPTSPHLMANQIRMVKNFLRDKTSLEERSSDKITKAVVGAVCRLKHAEEIPEEQINTMILLEMIRSQEKPPSGSASQLIVEAIDDLEAIDPEQGTVQRRRLMGKNT